MEEILEDYDFELRIAHENHISIDTTALSPEEVALRIMEYCGV